MGTDYRIEVRRKSDDKLLGVADANCLKSIMDSTFDEMMNLDGRSSNDTRFTIEDVDKVENAAYAKMQEHYATIHEKKMMIVLAANTDIKRDLEEDIRYEEDDIKGLQYVISACGQVYGIIDCIAESLYHEVKAEGDDGEKYVPAYKFNGMDLPKKKEKWNDGKEYESSVYIWKTDVYCVVKADY